jgi:Thioredoxin
MKEVVSAYTVTETESDSLTHCSGTSSVQVRLHPWIQPWHPQSGYLARGVEAAGMISNDAQLRMIDAVYARFDDFVDEKVCNQTPNELYETLTTIAKEQAGIEEKQFRQNYQSDQVVKCIKWTQKHGRQRSIHVSPTVMINGIIFSDASSSWDVAQWKKVLDPLVAAAAAAAAAAASSVTVAESESTC